MAEITHTPDEHGNMVQIVSAERLGQILAEDGDTAEKPPWLSESDEWATGDDEW